MEIYERKKESKKQRLRPVYGLYETDIHDPGTAPGVNHDVCAPLQVVQADHGPPRQNNQPGPRPPDVSIWSYCYMLLNIDKYFRTHNIGTCVRYLHTDRVKGLLLASQHFQLQTW